MNDTPMDHPDELLAGYVDGTVDDDDRTVVEAHLDLCADCRAEVELAATGLAAMMALPQVAPPSVAAEVAARLAQEPHPDEIEGRAADAPAAGRWTSRRVRRAPVAESWHSGSRSTSRPGTGDRVRQRLAWASGAAVAAAAAIVVVFSLSNGGSDRPGPGVVAATSARAAAEDVVQSDTDYSRQSLDDLAEGFATSQESELAGASATETAPQASAPPAQPSPVPATMAPDAASNARGCLDQGTGLSAGLLPLRLEVASFEGSPAYIGVFRDDDDDGDPEAVVFFAVSQEDCTLLYGGRLAI